MSKKTVQNMGWPVFGPGRRNNGTVSSAGGSGTHDKDRKSLGARNRGRTRSTLRGPGVPPPRRP